MTAIFFDSDVKKRMKIYGNEIISKAKKFSKC